MLLDPDLPWNFLVGVLDPSPKFRIGFMLPGGIPVGKLVSQNLTEHASVCNAVLLFVFFQVQRADEQPSWDAFWGATMLLEFSEGTLGRTAHVEMEQHTE